MCCTLRIQDAKMMQKNHHLGTIPRLCRAISSQLRHVSTVGKNLLSSNICSTCPHNMVNFGLLAAEICWRVWGTPSYFNGYRVLAVLLHGSQVVSVSQTMRRWTEGATYVRQDDHHVGHWPTFLVSRHFMCDEKFYVVFCFLPTRTGCWRCHWQLHFTANAIANAYTFVRAIIKLNWTKT